MPLWIYFSRFSIYFACCGTESSQDHFFSKMFILQFLLSCGIISIIHAFCYGEATFSVKGI